jgi:hypothetical protein
MKPLAISVVTIWWLMVPLAAGAQHLGDLRSARGHHVAVIDADSREWQGRLLEVAQDQLTIELDAAPRRFTLDQVKRVDSHGDSVRDGLVKGALFGLLVGAIIGDARTTAASTMSYALIGLGADALNSCRHTVYRTPVTAASVSVRW